MLAKTLHNFVISLFNAAKITTEAVLVKLFACLSVPETAGIGADFISKNNSTVGKSAEFELKVNKSNSAFLPECLKLFVYCEGILLDCFDFFLGSELKSDSMIIVDKGVAEVVVLIGKFDCGRSEYYALFNAVAL